jgi:hypothetical protein
MIIFFKRINFYSEKVVNNEFSGSKVIFILIKHVDEKVGNFFKLFFGI